MLYRSTRPHRPARRAVGLGVEAERIYVDHCLTGTSRERPGLREALAACRAGDTLVVTKLDRPARSLPDARAIADELTARRDQPLARRVGLRPHRRGRSAAVQRARDGGRVRADLIRLRTVEGMKVAKAKGRLRGKQPKLASRRPPQGADRLRRRLSRSRHPTGTPAPRSRLPRCQSDDGSSRGTWQSSGRPDKLMSGRWGARISPMLRVSSRGRATASENRDGVGGLCAAGRLRGSMVPELCLMPPLDSESSPLPARCQAAWSRSSSVSGSSAFGRLIPTTSDGAGVRGRRRNRSGCFS